jgi:hypothetical protein
VGQVVTGCVWDYGDGTKDINVGCNPGDWVVHTWPTISGLRPYPQDCPDPPNRGDGVKDWTVTLTLTLANGTKPVNVYLEPMPVCY